jgi:copper homeostasis protein
MSQQHSSAITLEVCVDSLDLAVAAAQGGADRIELCARLDLDGITPTRADLEQALAQVAVPVFAMVRPRAGDFVYTSEELIEAEAQAREAVALGARGLVFGALDRSGSPDLQAVQRILDAAGGLPLTFHRAFDRIRAPHEALESLIDLGVARLLTTGGPPTAWEGREALRELVAQAGERLMVMPGGGVRQGHLHELLERTGAREVHSSVVLQV